MLNLFSDQLSKVILDFNPNTINANLLSGKGSITNLRLNVDVINEFLNKPPHGTLPFVKFTEIRLSELRVEVTSYTNLKKSPIVLVIEEIHASAVEPMEYHLDPANAQKKATPPPPQQQQSSNQARQQYGLLHRILDNLSIKINRIHLTFQTLGKFKTRRRGIWTPPPVSVTLENVEWISVSEAGNPGTPESVWAHNELFVQQNRFRKEGNAPQHRSYIIYKRLSMICHVRLSSKAHYEQTDKHEDVKSTALITNTQIDVHVAYIRRLRDAGVSGIDVDVLCHDMDINLDVATLPDSNDDTNASQSMGCDVGSFVHMMIGLLHCYYKDRSFVDPLLPDGVRNITKQHVPIGEVQYEKGVVNKEPEEEEEIGPDDLLPEISLMDDVESDSDYEEEPDEEHDEAFLEWKRRHDMQKDGQKDRTISDMVATDDTSTVEPTTQIEKLPKEESEKDDMGKKEYKRKRKAVIVIANGAQKFEKVSFSLSISRVNMKLFLPSHRSIGSTSLKSLDRHCVELLVEGLVAECIWPQVSGQMGGHVQCSFGYVHILDLLQRLCENQDDGKCSWTAVKLSPLLKIGTRLFQGHDIFALPQYLKKRWGDELAGGLDKCEEFPSMESRNTTWTWDRPRRGKRAFGLKSTISFVDEKLTTWSKTSVNHEACLGKVDIVLDSVPIDNMMKVFSNQNSLIDARWLSGDWTADICNDAIAADTFRMKDYLQPLPAIYQSRHTSSSLSMPSSELRSITAHLGSINIRVPNPGGGSISSFGMADVICGFTEATIIVSSDLPKSFLSGRIMACENSNSGFPNDPTDFSCSLESQQAPSSDESTQFRMQVSVNNFSVDSMPMHQALLHRDDSNVKRLIAPTNVTLMTCLEQTGATKQSIIVSVLLQELECNMNLRLLCGALQTLNYHACNIMLKPNGTSQIDGNIAAKNNGGDKNVSLALCFHMPDISVRCWGEDSNLQSRLLFQVKAKQFELGSESMMGGIEHRSVLKIAIDSISVDVCSEGDIMLELLSIGIGTSRVSALGQRAVESCSISNAAVAPKDGCCLSLRVENHCDVRGTMPSLSYAIDNKSPLAISLSFDALEVFLKKVVNALSLPVLEQSTSISIGNSIFASLHQLCSIFSSSKEDFDAEVYHEERARNTLMRFFLSQIILLVVSDEKSFLLLLKDIEIASGQYDKIASLTENPTGQDLLVCKHCGGDNQTWLDAHHLIDPDTKEARATFYAMKLQNTIMSVASGNSFDIVLPQNVVDYRSPIPKGGSSKQSLIDIKSMKKMMRHSMKVGKSFSSSYYKLYSMLHATLSSDLSPTAMRLHKLIADYHEKMQAVIRHMDAEVHSLREGIFLKERERIGALALASSTASGWVRVGEDSSFSNARLFTSATFWRYWMVLDKSVIVLYKAPGCTAPSFIIPMHKSTKLRTISMASSSNKNTVVGNHLRQRGFALFDESEGMELFFVTNNQTEYDMFVSSIGRVLKLMQTDSNTNVQKGGNESVDISNSNNSKVLLSEAGTVSQTNTTADVDPSLHEAIQEEASDPNNILSVSQATVTIDTITEDSHVEVMEEMIDIQLDNEVGESTDAAFVDGGQSQYNQTQNTQLLRSENASTSKASTNASLSMRERLALAKGKSKLASSKFGSTLKNAKQITREDIKQKGSQKMTVFKQTANTTLSSAAVLGKTSLIQATTAVRSSIHEQTIRTANSSDSMDKNNPSKIEKVNKSMTSAMQRLHIDEKVTKISTAVKSVRSENQVMRQLSSEMVSRRKIGIAEEHMNKPVKFDARETFTAISGHPTKVKSIVSGASLATNDQVCAPAELRKFDRSWFVDVSTTGSMNGTADVSANETTDVSTKPHHQMKYKITLTDVCNEVNKHSVERSISELLAFHVNVSELLAKTSILRDNRNTSSFERLQVAGSLLERMIEGNTPSQSYSSVTDMHCEWIKIFASMLLESYLPEQVLKATTDFFDFKDDGDLARRKIFAGSALHSGEESCAATTEINEAFDDFAIAASNPNQSFQSYGLVSSANDRVGSQLLEIIMTAYNEATSERDSALATLAVSSVVNDHHIMQKQLARDQSNKAPVGGMRSSDDEMLALCKQLGSEIAAKTDAEFEIKRLKEQLELERKCAQAKEAELLEQLSKKK